MQLILDLPEDLIKDIQFEADHEKISVQEWLKKAISRNVWCRKLQNREIGDRPDISEVVADLMKDVPPEDFEMLPDLRELDHYLWHSQAEH